MSIFEKIKEKRELKKAKGPEEVNVSSKHLVLRIILFLVFLGVGITGIVVGCTYNSTHLEPGWHPVSCTEGENNSEDLTLMCYFSDGKRENASQMKTVTNYYTKLCNNAYKIFNEYKIFEETNGVAYINAHPNEDIKVEEALYNAFKKANDNNVKQIFYCPIMDNYHNLFKAESDAEAIIYDPYYDLNARSMISEIIAYLNNEDVKITLKENNTVRLEVSEEYLNYSKTNNINKYVSFSYFYNSVIVDYIFEHLSSSGVPNFKIYSYDGCYRSHFTDSSLTDSYLYYAYTDEHIIPTGKAKLVGSNSLVELKIFPISQKEDYYVYIDKQFVHHFLDDDGYYKSCVNGFTLYNNESMPTYDLLLKGSKVFTADSLNVDVLRTLGNFIYNDGTVIKYSDDKLEITDLFDKDGMTFTKELI